MKKRSKVWRFREQVTLNPARDMIMIRVESEKGEVLEVVFDVNFVHMHARNQDLARRAWDEKQRRLTAEKKKEVFGDEGARTKTPE